MSGNKPKQKFCAYPAHVIGDRRMTLCTTQLLLRFSLDAKRKPSPQTYSPAELGARLNYHPSTISNNLHALEKLGCIKRSRSDRDGRQFCVEVVYQKEGFRRIPARVLPMQFSLTDLRLLLAICYFDYSRGNGCFAHDPTLAKKGGLKAADISGCLSRLNHLGLIRVASTSGKKRKIFVIHDHEQVPTKPTEADCSPQMHQIGPDSSPEFFAESSR